MKEKTFTLRMSAELHQALKIAAIKEGMTLHDYCIKLLSQGS